MRDKRKWEMGGARRPLSMTRGGPTTLTSEVCFGGVVLSKKTIIIADYYVKYKLEPR